MYSLDLTGFSEYLFTLGILLAFGGIIFSAWMSRKHIISMIKESKIRKWHLIGALIIALLFLSAEIAIVKPTQLLFFDDAIYQAGALDLLRMGQAWMCNYGSPLTCYSGQIYHEPIGTSFTLAIGYLFFGVQTSTAYGTLIAVTFLAVIMSFFVATLLLDDPIAGLFSELILGLSPVVLVWAAPTTSDMPMLFYSLVAIFFLILFIKRKDRYTLLGVLLSISLVSYMKVDALIYVPVMLLMFIVLDKGGIRKNFLIFKRNVLETAFLVVLLVFVISIMPEAVYTYNQITTGNYGVNMGGTPSYGCFLMPNSPSKQETLGFSNFLVNFCSNVQFWFNSYSSNYIMQPILYTIMAILGAIALALRKPRVIAALLIWFLAFFVVYTSFYAGSVLYGVDWRFMLALIAPVSIAAGYFASLSFAKNIKRFSKIGSAHRKLSIAVKIAAYAIVFIAIFYPIYAMEPLLSIQPSNIPQAANARYYENFINNNVSKVPANCLIFSYDPTLIIINNRTSAQMGDLYQSNYYTYTKQYSCLVVDIGYWCYTPDNYCGYVENNFDLKSIVNSTYLPSNETFGLYMITGIKNMS